MKQRKVVDFMKSRSVFFFIFLFILIFFVYNMSFDKLKAIGYDITIYPVQAEAGDSPHLNVSLRGASFDDQWYNPEDLSPVGNWKLDSETHIYTAVDSTALTLRIPFAKKTDLVFDVGPDQGSAQIQGGTFAATWNFYQESNPGCGNGFSIPRNPVLNILMFISGLIAIFTFAIFLVFAFFIENRKNQINWNFIEKCFIIILLPLSVLVLNYFSLSSTPRIAESTNFWGYDAAVYKLLGKAWANGMIPYRDIFEHKGPIIFFIYMLGYLINAHWGVFILQFLALYCSLIVAYYIGKTISDISIGISASLATLVFFILLIDEGALIEEFNLPFLMISTLLILKYFQNIKNDLYHPPRYAFLYGIACGVSLGMRVTNCVSILCMVFCIAVMLLRRKQYYNILQNARAMIFGFLIIILPFVIYFAIYGELYGLLHGTLLFNFQYTGTAMTTTHTLEEWKQIIIYFTPAIVCILLTMEKRTYERISISFAAAVTMILLSKLYLFTHYYIIILPFVPVAVSWLLEKKEDNYSCTFRYFFSYVLVASITFFTVINYTYQFALDRYGWIQSLHQSANPDEYTIEVERLGNLIPPDDRDSVLGYNVRSDWYLTTDILPCYKYYGGQDWLFSFQNKEVIEDSLTFFQSLSAKWIIVQDEIGQSEIAEIVKNNYILYDSCYSEEKNCTFRLYKLND